MTLDTDAIKLRSQQSRTGIRNIDKLVYTDVPALLAEVDRLRARVTELEENARAALTALAPGEG